MATTVCTDTAATAASLLQIVHQQHQRLHHCIKLQFRTALTLSGDNHELVALAQAYKAAFTSALQAEHSEEWQLAEERLTTWSQHRLQVLPSSHPHLVICCTLFYSDCQHIDHHHRHCHRHHQAIINHQSSSINHHHQSIIIINQACKPSMQ